MPKKFMMLLIRKNISFLKLAKDNDELYGSIKPKDISKIIEETDKIQIKPSQIDLSSEINKIGTYEFQNKFTRRNYSYNSY